MPDWDTEKMLKNWFTIAC